MMPLDGLRECRATSFDQTPIGKWSSAGRLTRNAPKLSNHDCAGTRVNAAPRRDIRRGPRLAMLVRTVAPTPPPAVASGPFLFPPFFLIFFSALSRRGDAPCHPGWIK